MKADYTNVSLYSAVRDKDKKITGYTLSGYYSNVRSLLNDMGRKIELETLREIPGVVELEEASAKLEESAKKFELGGKEEEA